MGLRNVEMEVLKNPSNFRKMAMGNWDGTGDPQIYGTLELDCVQALAYLARLRQEHNVHVTVNHLIGRIMALVLRRYPQINGLISCGKVCLRKNVDIFFQVGIENAETELVGICVKDGDKKGLIEFTKEMLAHTEAVRSSANHPMRKTQRPFRHMPWRVARWMVKFISWLQYDVNLNLSGLGIPKDPLGSIMITAIGTLGFEFVFVPLTHIGRTPMQIAVGKATPRAVVVDNQIVIRPQLTLACTLDHRFVDGVLGSKMAKMLKELFENVEKHHGLIEGTVPLDNYQIFPPKTDK